MRRSWLLAILAFSAAALAAEEYHQEFSKPPRLPDPEREMRRLRGSLGLNPMQEGEVLVAYEDINRAHMDGYELRKEFWLRSGPIKSELKKIDRVYQPRMKVIEDERDEIEDSLLQILTKGQRKKYLHHKKKYERLQRMNERLSP